MQTWPLYHLRAHKRNRSKNHISLYCIRICYKGVSLEFLECFTIDKQLYVASEKIKKPEEASESQVVQGFWDGV